MILGIDPSFTSTGVCLLDEDTNEIISHSKISGGNPVYKGINLLHEGCENIVCSIDQLLSSVHQPFDVIVEYPAFATQSGAYLGVLNGYLFAFLSKHSLVRELVWVPPTAVDSFTKNRKHSKTYLVNFVKDNYGIVGRFSHDESTALILAHLLVAIRNNEYKNSYFKYNKAVEM